MGTYYENDILSTLRGAGKPLRMREIVDRIAPDSYGAYSSIGNALTHLYRAGRVMREKPGRWYVYSCAPERDLERIVLHVDRRLWAAFQVECERRGYTASQVVELAMREQLEAWSLIYEE